VGGRHQLEHAHDLFHAQEIERPCRPVHQAAAVPVQRGQAATIGQVESNAVKFFSSIELMTLFADRDWLDGATKTIRQFWKRKNARQNGLILKEQADIQLKARSAQQP
jgi:hypothetical protein